MKKFNFEKFGFYRNIFFVGFFALFLCLLLFASTVHAEGITSVLPYVPNSNDFALDDSELQTLQDFLDENNSSFNIFTDSCFIFVSAEQGWYDNRNYTTLKQYNIYFPQSNSCNSIWSSLTDAENFTFYNSNNYLNVTFPDRTDRISVLVRGSYYGWYYNPGWSNNLSRQFYGSHDLVNVNNGFYEFSYYQNYPVYTNDIFSTLDPNRVVIDFLSYPQNEPSISIGHATQPNNDPNNFINGSDGNPISRPTKPNPSPFSPSVWNPPSLDTSTIETLLESIWECLDYGFDYLKDNFSGWFGNLLSNLDSWFGYLVDSIYYTGNKIVKSIQDLATDLYNNFVSLFEPFFDFLASVVSFFDSLVALGTDENGNFSLTTFIVKLIVPDPEDLAYSLIEHDEFGFISLVGALKTKVTSTYNSIFNISAVKIFTIPSFTAFGVTFPAYQMDFSWFDNYKVYSDTIISGFLIIGYFHWLFTTISTHIRGGSVIAGDVTEPDKKGGH